MTTRPATVPVIRDGSITEASADEVDWEFPDTHFTGSHASQVPGMSAVAPTRVFYGARFSNQAVEQVDGEAPLVQSLEDPDKGTSFEEVLGAANGAVFADEDGEVADVQPDSIVLKTTYGRKTIPLYRNFPFNRKSALIQTPVVQPGQKVTKGMPLARSNYTDKQGRIATGLNVLVAAVPYLGHSMDDAVVISESLARRMRSGHSHMSSITADDNTRFGKQHFHAVLPQEFVKEQLDKLDDDGVAVPGAILNPGDPIILATRPRAVNSASVHSGQLGKMFRQMRANASEVWDGEDPAEVVRVSKTPGGHKVLLRYTSPTRPGDKVTFRSGTKGVTSLILPDDQMPQTESGDRVEFMYNPLGLVSRTNAQLPYEMMLGKIAAARGTPYKLPSFTSPDTDWNTFVRQELAKAGMQDKERIYDPKFGRWLKQPVLVGRAFLQKLHHTAESKFAARSTSGYDANQQPSKGGDSGAKRISGLETSALRSSGGVATLREMSLLRGQQSPEFWKQWREGGSPGPAGMPFVWRKYRALLEGAGLRNKDMGDGVIRLGPMTDAEIMARQPVEIRNGGILNLKNMTPVEGGLFDPAMVSAGKWGVVALPRPVPNPIMEESIRRLLGLTRKEFQQVLAGEMELPARQ